MAPLRCPSNGRLPAGLDRSAARLIGDIALLNRSGRTGSDRLSNARFGLPANALQTSYRHQTGPPPASDPAYAITNMRVRQHGSRIYPTLVRGRRQDERAARPVHALRRLSAVLATPDESLVAIGGAGCTRRGDEPRSRNRRKQWSGGQRPDTAAGCPERAHAEPEHGAPVQTKAAMRELHDGPRGAGMGARTLTQHKPARSTHHG
jgi:hypothetical protein